ncbi:MAG: hypothetical protein WC796_06415 [Candidatus Pacearchaeota archaeon]|jgi:hypothetical protein
MSKKPLPKTKPIGPRVTALHEAIEARPDADLVKTILYSPPAEYVEPKWLRHHLEVGKREFDKAFNFLKEINAVTPHQLKDTFIIADHAQRYLNSELPFGPGGKEYSADSDSLQRALESVWDMVHFTFFKKFVPSRKLLEKLRKQVEQQVETIQQSEQKYWQTVLHVPDQYASDRSNIPSFVEADGSLGEKKDYGLVARFKLPSEAILTGFDDAFGHLIYLGPDKNRPERQVLSVEAGRRKCNISVWNLLHYSRWPESNKGFPYVQRLKQRTKELTSRLEEALS